jgi:hypothetical protein
MMNMKVKKVDIRRIDSSERQKTARCYFFPKGESIIENLQNRRSRPHKEYRKLLPEVFKSDDVINKLWKDGHIKASWSQYAGCSCGCSSGFILKGLYGYNIFVDVE